MSGTATMMILGFVLVVVAIACPFFPVQGPSGFRTPWTYASRRSWIVTQRAAAVVYVVLGIWVLVAAYRSWESALFVFFFGTMASAFGLSVVSWGVARQDSRSPTRSP